MLNSPAITQVGYDPAGIMNVIKYEGVDSKPLEEFMARYRVYKEIIKHADEEHGALTPDGPGGMMQMDMGGMDMEGGEH